MIQEPEEDSLAVRNTEVVLWVVTGHCGFMVIIINPTVDCYPPVLGCLVCLQNSCPSGTSEYDLKYLKMGILQM